MAGDDIKRFRSYDEARAHEIEQARRESPSDKLASALELMKFGYEMQQVALRLRDSEADEGEIERRFFAWLQYRDAC